MQMRHRQKLHGYPDARDAYPRAGRSVQYRVATCLYGCASGYDIVDNKNMLVLDTLGMLRNKGMLHILPTLLPILFRLRSAREYSAQDMFQHRNASYLAQPLSNKRALIVASQLLLVFVQWNRQNTLNAFEKARYRQLGTKHSAKF